ncbi:hypothetical protein KEJ48_01715 [Candidatus Bathyarchaeota archaeon]|nr:hypothetical protein [Candidatus Bathyarchaeota archaeon]MBS7618262.1 hypothetical protein [Candidatus Bathyarchaeota archaeon]
MKLRDLSATVINAALYASLGYLTYLGLFTPVIGVVRFWPSVIVPGFFSVVYGSMVGGLGAAIGIFISDMAIHGNALLSLLVGVPSNFLGFYVMGLIARKRTGRSYVYGSIVFLMLIVVLTIFLYGLNVISDLVTAVAFVSACVVSIASIAVVYRFYPELSSYGIASVTGLALGSGIIGVGVWGFSQFLVLPTGEMNLPVQAALIWFIWTFITEIPFLTAIVPPVLKVFFKAYPSLNPLKQKERKTSEKS